MRPNIRSRKAFTLTEVMTTVAIIAILAGMALPGYQRTMERSYWREAQDLLMTVYSGERAFFFSNNRYATVTVPADWRTIYMDDPNLGSIPVAFTVTGCAPAPCNTFTARATRQGGPFMEIDETRNFDYAGGWTMP